MKFIYGKNDLLDLNVAEGNCYLITNGLGGFSSLSIAGSSARSDHSLFIGALRAPNKRYSLIANTMESVKVGKRIYNLSSQRYQNDKSNLGIRNLQAFSYEYLPEYRYKAGPVEVIKTITMKHGENTLGIKYQVINHSNEAVQLKVVPLLSFCPKGAVPLLKQKYELKDNTVISEGITLKFKTDGKVMGYEQGTIDDLFYAYDECDGRNSKGVVHHNHEMIFEGAGDHYIIYSLDNIEHDIDGLIKDEISRQKALEEISGLRDETAKVLVRAADAYIAHRDSTDGKTILAGYPFFEDWGRDTMIALAGCTLSTRQFDTAKSILRTFMKYCHKGIMPNLFPEGGDEPMYNTVDASLLFINAVYEYYKASGDKEFVAEAMLVIEDIIDWYMKGTDYAIGMDEATGLIKAGSGLWQVTWMDVRVGDILPTPRHGMPVEINAYWYNGLMIADEFCKLLGKGVSDCKMDYRALADKVKVSFKDMFWNEAENCLKDLVSGTEADNQIRCNQIWAASMPYSVLDEKMARAVIDKVYEELYTPVGLRSLSPRDKEFHPTYGGPMLERDLAYHQGTVWGFPLGGYYLAYLKWARDKQEAKAVVRRQLEGITAALREGCAGHLAEIYDGLEPAASRGCFAQAWSIGEILRVYAELEAE